MPDMPAFRQKLLDYGAIQLKPRLFEQNIRYDNAWGGLARAGKVLRLRQDDGVRLTYKGIPPSIEETIEFKVREEIELTVQDCNLRHNQK